jgi:predicted nucleic acid-binding protein
VIVVADASPLRYLILIEHVHVLPALYGRVLIPPAVIAELNRERTPDLVRAWLAKSPDWLHVQAPREALTGLGNVLGDGERQAIALAVEMAADALLMSLRPLRPLRSIVTFAPERAGHEMRRSVPNASGT